MMVRAKALRKHTVQMDGRDVIWFVVDNERLATNYPGNVVSGFIAHLHETFAEEQSVLLIGKDGGVKMRAKRLAISEIFSGIDAMPMRQREMR